LVGLKIEENSFLEARMRWNFVNSDLKREHDNSTLIRDNYLSKREKEVDLLSSQNNKLRTEYFDKLVSKGSCCNDSP